MRTRPFKQVDVFTAVALKGNPVAVILDAEGLSAGDMQAIANWTNLSETTFVTPATDPAADYSVRIFTPGTELPFAGHPTLGTAHAVIEAGMAACKDGKLIQQCEVGLVEVSQSEEGLSFRLPRYAYRDAPETQALAKALGEAAIVGVPQIVDVGPNWMVAELETSEMIETLSPNALALADYDQRHGTVGQTLFAQNADGSIVVRTFSYSDGIGEDPVCGSGNGAVAAYRLRAGQIGADSSYNASQGRQIGRDGHIRIRIQGDAIHVGGNCVTVVDGVFRF